MFELKCGSSIVARLEHYSDDDLRILLGAITAELARRANEATMTAEQAEEISRRST